MPKKVMKKHVVAVPPSMNIAPDPVVRSRRLSWRFVIAGLVFLSVVLLAANKGWVVVAVVDGKPIYSWRLTTLLRSRYGAQTLEGMIGEALIEKEARKSGVIVSDSDLQTKQKEIVSSFGETMSLSDFLKFQGLSESEFNQQLKVQLTVERLLTKNLTITEADIDRYIATNRALLVSTEAASLREEAKRAIISNTVSEQIQSWFMNLRKDAKVVKFL